MITVVLPYHLRNLAGVEGDVQVEVVGSPTIGSVLEALEARYPVLRGTIREHVTLRRRRLVRFFAAGEDISHEPPDHLLPEPVASGAEPFYVIGAIAGGSG